MNLRPGLCINIASARPGGFNSGTSPVWNLIDRDLDGVRHKFTVVLPAGDSGVGRRETLGGARFVGGCGQAQIAHFYNPWLK